MIFFTGPGEMKWSEKLSWLVTVSIFAASVSTNHEMMKTVQLVFHTVMIKTCFGNVHTFYCTALLNIYMDVFSFQHQLLLLKTFFFTNNENNCLDCCFCSHKYNYSISWAPLSWVVPEKCLNYLLVPPKSAVLRTEDMLTIFVMTL